jgi:hypothetical protein
MNYADRIRFGAKRLWRGVKRSTTISVGLLFGFVFSVTVLYLNAGTGGLTFTGKVWILPLLPLVIPPVAIWYLWEMGKEEE